MTPESGRAGVPPGAGLGVPAHGSTAADGRSSSRAPRACPSSPMASVCLGSRLGSGAGGGGEAGSEEKRERWPGAPGTGDHQRRQAGATGWAGNGVRRPGVVLWGLQRSGLAHSNPLGHPGGTTPGRWGRGRGPGGRQPGGPWRSPGLMPCDRPECRVARHQSVRFALRTSEQLLGSVFRSATPGRRTTVGSALSLLVTRPRHTPRRSD